MPFKLTFYPASLKATRIESLAGRWETVVEALEKAMDLARDIVPDCELLEIEGEGVSQLWIRRGERWKRDDNAKRP